MRVLPRGSGSGGAIRPRLPWLKSYLCFIVCTNRASLAVQWRIPKATAGPLRLRSGQAFDSLRCAAVAQDDSIYETKFRDKMLFTVALGGADASDLLHALG